jgi:hypothetical protein
VNSKAPASKEEQVVARVTSVAVDPKDIEESVRLFDDSVVPAARQEEGFLGVLLLVRDDGRALAIDLCDTLENLRANERSGFYQAQIAKFAEKITGHPTREVYDVAVAHGLEVIEEDEG